MWGKPPTPPDSDEEDGNAVLRGLDARRPWQGVLDRPRQPPGSFKPAREQRVRGGHLDYKSQERLGTLRMLRHISEAPEAELRGIESMALVALGGASHRAGRSASTRSLSGGETALEREARRGWAYAHTEWSEWEAKWADQLRGLAAAAERAKRASRVPAVDDDDVDDQPLPSHQPHRGGPGRHPPHPSARPPHARRSSSPGSSRQGAPAHASRRQPPPSPPPQQPPPPPPPPPPRRPQQQQPPPPPPPKVGRQFATWSEFDVAFGAFEEALPAASVVQLADVPFPPASDPAGLVAAGVSRAGGDPAKRKKLLHKALLRWHPDKWARVLSKVGAADAGALHERLQEITQALVALKS